MSNDFQIDREDEEEGIWWELWDRRRRMAVAQAVCYVASAIYILRANYESQQQCNDSVMSKKDRKRKAREWEKKFESIREAVNDVAEAIKEGDGLIELSKKQRIYTEREVYAELVKIGVERHLRYTAYSFLTQDPSRVRAFFGLPVNDRKDFLLQMMFDPN